MFVCKEPPGEAGAWMLKAGSAPSLLLRVTQASKHTFAGWQGLPTGFFLGELLNDSLLVLALGCHHLSFSLFNKLIRSPTVGIASFVYSAVIARTFGFLCI
jgi:hypothetical protein